MASLYRITRAIEGNGLTGSLSVAAVAGTLVCPKDNTTASGVTSTMQDALFELATGKKAFLLNRDVIAPPRPLESILFQDSDILSPVLTGQQILAREVQEAEFEGPAFLDASITSALPINTKLTTLNGTLAVLSDGPQTKAAFGVAAAGPVTLAGVSVGDTVQSVTQINQLEIPVLGHNGAGSVTLAGALVGDVVARVINVTAGTDVTADFEAAISVAGQIQQTNAANLSAANLIVVLGGPASSAGYFEATISVAGQIQQSSAANLSAREFEIVTTASVKADTVGKLTGYLAPEDSGNTYRIRVQFEH